MHVYVSFDFHKKVPFTRKQTSSSFQEDVYYTFKLTCMFVFTKKPFTLQNRYLFDFHFASFLMETTVKGNKFVNSVLASYQRLPVFGSVLWPFAYRSKQQVTKVVPLCKNGGKHGDVPIHFMLEQDPPYHTHSLSLPSRLVRLRDEEVLNYSNIRFN